MAAPIATCVICSMWLPNAGVYMSLYVNSCLEGGAAGYTSSGRHIPKHVIRSSKHLTDNYYSKILRIKERRAYRDGIKRKGDKIGMVSVVSSKMEVVSEELGVPGVITPPLYRRTMWISR